MKPTSSKYSRDSVSLALFALILSVALAHAEPRMTAHFLDVGQGAATLLEFP